MASVQDTWLLSELPDCLTVFEGSEAQRLNQKYGEEFNYYLLDLFGCLYGCDSLDDEAYYVDEFSTEVTK